METANLVTFTHKSLMTNFILVDPALSLLIFYTFLSICYEKKTCFDKKSETEQVT